VPAIGVWLITEPAGTVVLDAVVTAPTVRFAPTIALVAAVWVNPTTVGTAVVLATITVIAAAVVVFPAASRATAVNV
jgi:hypothetical protein